MEEEVKIISKHNLDCSTLENLANDIAKRLGSNIEYGQYQKVNGNHKFVLLGTVEVIENGIKTTLYDLRNDENSSYNFILELGEEAKVIYEDFIEFMPAWEEQYENVVSINNQQGLTNDSFYNRVFDELQKLGADKVVLFQEDANEQSQPNLQNSFENVLNSIKGKVPYFEVKL